MGPKLRRIKIENLFGYKNIDMELDDITVLVGNNGTGKSTILRIIHSLLTLSESESLRLCEYAQLWLNNGIRIKYENFRNDNSKEIFEKIFVDTINSEEVNVKKMDSDDILRIMTKKLDKYKKSKKINKFRVFNVGTRVAQNLYYKDVLENIGIEYISTVDLSANSRFNFNTIEGEDSNMLDNYIELEIVKLFSSRDDSVFSVFRRVMNDFLSDSGKRLVSVHINKVMFRCPYSGKLSYKELSSGERQLLYIVLKVVNGRDKGAVILMDEPEISLHLNWQEKLIDSIKYINEGAQLIIVTHSPGIVMNGYRDAFRDMKDIVVDKING